MKTHNLKFILLALIAAFATSCTTMLYTSLDVLRPAKVTFSLNANNLLIVNNSIIQPSNIGHKTQRLNQQSKKVNVPCDSLAILCLSALNEELDTKSFFNSVKLLPNKINKGSDFEKPAPLSDEAVTNLCKSNRANVILSLDKIKVTDELNEFNIYNFDGFITQVYVTTETSWSIHYPGKKDAQSISFKDMLWWELSMQNKPNTVTKALPNSSDFLKDAALDAGRNSVNKFLPYWEKVDRYFFNSTNKLMKQGMDSVYVKNWESAISIWKKVFEKENLLTKAQAANNIAIAYEILGDIDKAYDYALKSINFYDRLPFYSASNLLKINLYIQALNQRKQEIKLLKEQVGE